jgi:16S rRNA (adenine1518-N6/adenine1519-N6)-dimethyltransferase
MNLEELKFLLKQYRLTPNKVRGQNFLISNEVLEKIITAAQLTKNDLVLEVGPGLGALTQPLLKSAGQVVAFEVDKNFQPCLAKLVAVADNLEIIWQSILELREEEWLTILKKYKKNKYKIVANLPYYLTGKFIQKFILIKHKPESLVLMVQKEVAERIIKKNKKSSLLSLAIDFYAQSELIEVVPKGNFYPQPQVDSAIMRIYNLKDWHHRAEEKIVWQLVHRGFASKRKKLFNNLLTDQNISRELLIATWLKVRLDKNIRAEDLTAQQWLDLVANLKN